MLDLKTVNQLAREHNLTIIVKRDGYAICDENLETIAVYNNLKSVVWYINNRWILNCK